MNRGNLFKRFVVKVSKEEIKHGGKFMIKRFLLHLSFLVDCFFIWEL